MYKALFIGDIHMSNKLPYALPSQCDRTDRLDDQLRLWEHVHKVAKAEEVDATFVLGDLLDKSLVDAVTLTHTVEALVKSPVHTYILPGNHDANSLRGGRFTVEAFGAMGRDHIEVIGGGYLEPRDWLRFWPIAFKPLSETREDLKAIRVKMDHQDLDGRTNVLLFHNSILGAKHLGWVCDDGLAAAEVCEGFDWVLSGHFHDHQEFGDGVGMYLSAPMHHHFGDVGRDAGFWVIEFHKDGSRDDKFIPSRMPRFHKVLGFRLPLRTHKGDYIRFEIEATHADWAKLKLQAVELTERLRADGYHADYKHKPIYHHEARLVPQEEAATLSMEDAVTKYVEMAGVVTGGLDQNKLRDIGREALRAVRSGHGTG